jgi:hypothetical protein
MLYDTGATHSACNGLEESLHHSPHAHGKIRTQAGLKTLQYYQVKLELVGLEQPAGSETFVGVPDNWGIQHWVGHVAEGAESVVGMTTLQFWGVKFDPRTGKFSKA